MEIPAAVLFGVVRSVLLPVLTFCLGLVAVFMNPEIRRRRRLTIGLACLLLLVCGFDIWSNLDRQAETTKLTKTLESFQVETRISFADLKSRLQQFGWLGDRATVAASAYESFGADGERRRLMALSEPARRTKTTVQYFPKDVDQKIVEASLRELGFRLTTGLPHVADIPTNAIWFGEQVRLEDVKLVAFTLMRAGVQIQVIRPFRSPAGHRSSLVQVGSNAAYLDRPPLTVEEIRRASGFQR